MARLLPDTYNVAIAAATAQTSISEQPQFPLTRLRYATPTDVTRTKTGWDVEAGFNDKLDFSEAGNARVATLAPGNYATGALYAAQVQSAMNAAPGATNTYTVTYDGSTSKATIARATGVDAVVLKWSTGANASASCGKDLGFNTSSDDSGGTSYLADSSAYQSRRWIKLDLGSALAATAGWLLGHNLSAAGVATLQGNATALVAAGAVGSVNHVLVGTTKLRILFFVSASYRYWRLLVEDVQNAAGYFELGILYVGTFFEPSGTSKSGFQHGMPHSAEDLTIVERADNGAVYQSKKAKPRRYEATYALLNRADKLTYQAIEDADPHVLLVLRPTDYPVEESYYGVIKGPAVISRLRTKGEFYRLGIFFTENLG